MYVIVNGCHLFEMTQAELDHSIQHNGADYQRVVSVPVAHDWVRRGYPHSTALYIDAGRIRRAG